MTRHSNRAAAFNPRYQNLHKPIRETFRSQHMLPTSECYKTSADACWPALLRKTAVPVFLGLNTAVSTAPGSPTACL
jgi:hypothetical protein